MCWSSEPDHHPETALSQWNQMSCCRGHVQVRIEGWVFLPILAKNYYLTVQSFLFLFFYFSVIQLKLQSSSSIQLCYSVIDIKELKFLDICTTATKPNCEQGVSTETGSVPPGGHSHTSRITSTPETNSNSHLNPAPVTILRKGKYILIFTLFVLQLKFNILLANLL